MRLVDKLDKLPADEVARACWSSEAGLTGGAGRALPGAGDDQRHRRLLRGAGARPRASTDDAARRGPGRARRRDRGLRRRWSTDRVRSRPTCAIARGLDYYTGTVFETRLDGYERLGSICSRRPLRRARRRRPDDLPGRRHLARRQPRCWCPLLGRGRAHRRPAGAVARCWSPWSTRSHGPPATQVATALRARGIPCEVAAAAAPKFGKQIRYAERRGIPFVWFPGADGGHEVKDIRIGEQVAADPEHLDPARRGPDAAGGLHQTEETAAVIRTHDAGALRAEHVGQTVTLAGWVARRRDHGGVAFIDLREASGVAQVVVRDEAVAHSLRTEYCLRGHRRGGAAPGGQRQPEPAHRRDRGRSPPTVEVLSAAAPLPFPIDDARRRSARRPGSSTATWTCAATGPNARAAAAQQGQQGRPRRAGRARLRRDRDADADPLHARGRPRLPGARPAAARAAGTRCRRARSCSSSC